ncbi:MAG: translation initiation factor IF-2 subunit beta [Candidatus Diapherotrites archaeon]|uniref:Translation initiation factor 2 subunit beta n=1 Tax=Candidatus Iainarchaeum sp. TaxID=3101447 RepID=A0A497JIJ2_9ARCH|nr:translation initiation factor IF-2 subunit beta [Candidatus Diapherotrites archaeon]RLG69550.1 MAG: translation initiation factor IF-2 subunit beta [Candidatus Diapherotrites archaeon]
MKYEEMLERAYKSMPEKTLKRERFEMPKVQCFVQGNRTVVNNFSKILSTINRDEKHALKYITKQLATAASIDAGRLVLKGVFRQEQIQRIIDDYIKTFVLCTECGRPDTKIIEQKGVKMLKCTACGAIAPLRD